jgi:hypothetical protein
MVAALLRRTLVPQNKKQLKRCAVDNGKIWSVVPRAVIKIESKAYPLPAIPSAGNS